MNHGLVIGIAISAVAHSAVLLMFNHRPAEDIASAEETKSIEVVDLPLPEQLDDNLDFSESDAPPSAEPRMSYAPPMLADAPSLVTVDSFVQPLQPPPLEPPKPGAIVIPVSRFNKTGAEIEQLFNLRDLDRPPRPIVQVPPIPPKNLLSRDDVLTSGRVVVRFVVDAEGKVRDPVIEESHREEYEECVIDAVLKWRFRPGRKDGRDVSTTVRIPFDFTPPSEE